MPMASRRMRPIGLSYWELRNKLPSAHPRDAETAENTPKNRAASWRWLGLTDWNRRAVVLCPQGLLCIIIHHNSASVPNCRVRRGGGTIQVEGFIHAKNVEGPSFAAIRCTHDGRCRDACGGDRASCSGNFDPRCTTGHPGVRATTLPDGRLPVDARILGLRSGRLLLGARPVGCANARRLPLDPRLLGPARGGLRWD